MANFVRFRDSVAIRPVEIKQEVKDFYAQPQNVGQPLRIRVKATHAGKITRNNGFYLPHKMRAGVASWTDQYQKPIQVHHDDHADPVGRVVEASYVDISGGLARKFDSVKDSVKADKLTDFIQGKLSSDECVTFVKDHYLIDNAITDDPDYEGLGYIELVADITDPDAIRKVLDKRYLTGSVGASTNEAVCSVCKKDWANEGEICEHRPGKVYDGVKCVIIAGDLTYDEWSFVNRPADSHSAVIETNFNGVQDFIQVEQSNIPEISFIIDKANEGDLNMTFKKAIQLVRADDRFKDFTDLEKTVKTLLDSLEDKTDDALIKALMEYYKIEAEEVLEGPPEPSTEDAVQDEEDPLKKFFGDEYEDLVGEDEWGTDYAQMVMEALTGELKGEDGEDLASYFQDAKLTAKSRKALPSSVFCKPPRGYPVNDCGHAKSAMAYAKKNNEASSVVACIRRKASRLGCPFKNEVEDATQSVPLFSVEYFDVLDDKELISAFDAFQEAFKERELNLTDESKFEDQIKVLKEENTTMVTRVDNLRREIGYLYEDIDNLQTELYKVISDRKMDNINVLFDMTRLAGNTIEDYEEFKNSYTSKSFDDVCEELKTIKDNLDIQKLSDNLNSGLTNIEPKGEVEDPLPLNDNKDGDKIKVISGEQEQAIKDAVAELLKTKGPKAAEEFLQTLKARGVIAD